MRAWQYSSVAGGLEKNLKLVDNVAQPAVPANGILVKVAYASLNPADYKFPEAAGLLWRAVVSMPATPGMDWSGTVETVGAGAAKEFSVGQQVFGNMMAPGFRSGSLGEYVVATRECCAPLPAGVSLEHACCVGSTGLTALQSLGALRAGEHVFINGGSGGVGSTAIQMAKAMGARVTTSCSGANADLCRRLGADDVVDYTKTDVVGALKAKGRVFALAVDYVGTSPPDLYAAADGYLLPTGKFVQVGSVMNFAGMKSIAARSVLPSFLGGGKRKYQFCAMKTTRDDLEKIARWMADGKVKVLIDEVFDFKDVPKAYTKLRTGRARGNIVVKH